jgi:hypothetical protein
MRMNVLYYILRIHLYYVYTHIYAYITYIYKYYISVHLVAAHEFMIILYIKDKQPPRMNFFFNINSL